MTLSHGRPEAIKHLADAIGKAADEQPGDEMSHSAVGPLLLADQLVAEGRRIANRPADEPRQAAADGQEYAERQDPQHGSEDTTMRRWWRQYTRWLFAEEDPMNWAQFELDLAMKLGEPEARRVRLALEAKA